MYARATTTISIMRGQIEDEWGDLKDLPNPIATGVRASIVEQKIYAKAEVTLQPRNIRYARLRMTRDIPVPVATNDRIWDEKLEQMWVIVNISPIQNPVIGQDLRIDLQFVG